MPTIKVDKKQAAEKIGGMYIQGCTMQHIANVLGISRQRVHQLMQDFDLCTEMRENWRANVPKKQKKKYIPVVRKEPAPGVNDARAFAKRSGLPDPYKRFTSNRLSAAKRGIGWGLTFLEWWELWLPYYGLRGRKKGQMVLCRTADRGAYMAGNVRVDLGKANHHERALEYRCAHKKRPNGAHVCWANANITIHQIEDEDDGGRDVSN